MQTQAVATSPCALVRPPQFDAPRRPVRAHSDAHHAHGPRRSPYRVVPHISHIDRAIIREYFRRANRTRRVLFVERELRDGAGWIADSQLIAPGEPGLPEALEQKLSVLPAGHARILAGNDVLLIETASRSVIDVMQDVHTTA